ncbi:universal stress protein [Streptomyces sp. NPDC058412]|uniref:universal stress protein n=1 Tax=Streptomyces TaxID=1883 RepID=UPI003664CAA5
MARPITVGVDGSEGSVAALDWAADEAALRGTSLRLVYATRGPSTSWGPCGCRTRIAPTRLKAYSLRPSSVSGTGSQTSR